MGSVEPTAGRCPWMGLSSYGADDSAMFFGRTKSVRSLLRILERRGAVGIVGASGIGKSSLLRAGLTQAGFSLSTFRPGPEPMSELRRAVTNRPVDASAPWVLAVDQLEEIFGIDPEESTRNEFLDALCELVLEGTMVAFALRSDHYGSCAAHPRFAELVARAHLLLGTPTETELREMVTLPASAASIAVPPDLVDEIVDAVSGEPGALPLVSHALTETFRFSPSGTLGWQAYRDAGGVRGAIATTAERAWQTLRPEQLRYARAMLVHLAEPSVEVFDRSRRLAIASLAPQGDVDRRATLDALVASRIVTLNGTNVEIAHEAVFREWPRLRSWLLTDGDNIRLAHSIRRAAQMWETSSRETDALLRGAPLAAARELIGADDTLADEVTREFVGASQLAADEELRVMTARATAARAAIRRLRALVGTVVVLALIAVTAGLIANHRANETQRERNIAEARRLAAESGTLLRDNGDLAALVAAEAYDLHPDAQTTGAMLAALTVRPGLESYIHDDFAFTLVALAPGGNVVALDDKPAAVGLWDIAGTQPRRFTELPVPSGHHSSAIAFVDNDLVVTDDGGNVTRFNTTSTNIVWTVTATSHAITSLAVGPSSDMIAVGDDQGDIELLDPSSGSLERQLSLDGAITAVALAPDGSRLTAATDTGDLRSWARSDFTQTSPSLDVGAEVWSMAYSPGADVLAVGTDSRLAFIDTVTGVQRGDSIDAHGGIVYAVAFVDKSTLVSGGEDGRVLFWDVDTRQMNRQPVIAHSAGVLALAIDSHGQHLVTAGDDLRVGIWNLSLGSAAAVPIFPDHPKITGIASNTSGLTAFAGADGQIRFTSATNRPAPPSIAASDGPLTSITMSADGHEVAVSERSGTIHVFNTASGASIIPPTTVGSRSASVALDPSGRWLAAVETDSDCVACTIAIDLHDASPRAVRLIPPARAGHANGIPSYAVAFDPTGNFLVSGDNAGHIDLWRLPATNNATGADFNIVWSAKIERGIRAATFSHDGSVLAVGANGGLLITLNSNSGKELQRLIGQRGRVAGLSFNPTDTLIASTGPDEGAARIWELSTGLPYGTPIETDADWVADPGWSASGEDLVVATRRGGPIAYHLDPARLRQGLCTLAQRNLTTREWTQYISTQRPAQITCAGIKPNG